MGIIKQKKEKRWVEKGEKRVKIIVKDKEK